MEKLLKTSVIHQLRDRENGIPRNSYRHSVKIMKKLIASPNTGDRKVNYFTRYLASMTTDLDLMLQGLLVDVLKKVKKLKLDSVSATQI